jgi:hypothetical protein
MPLSRLDIPAVREAVSDLYRILEDPTPTNPVARRVYEWAHKTTRGEHNPDPATPPGLIQPGIDWVMIQFGGHINDHCPEITDSKLDLKTQAALLELREKLLKPFTSQYLADEAGERAQFFVFLDGILARISPSLARPADPNSAGTGGIATPDGPVEEHGRLWIRWERERWPVDEELRRGWSILKAMWPPEDKKEVAVSEVKKQIVSKAKHPKVGINFASDANKVLRVVQTGFEVRKKRGAEILLWSQVCTTKRPG